MKLKNSEEKNDLLIEKETINNVANEVVVFDQINKLADIIIDYLLKDSNENKKVVSYIRGNVTESYLKEVQ